MISGKCGKNPYFLMESWYIYLCIRNNKHVDLFFIQQINSNITSYYKYYKNSNFFKKRYACLAV